MSFTVNILLSFTNRCGELHPPTAARKPTALPYSTGPTRPAKMHAPQHRDHRDSAEYIIEDKCSGNADDDAGTGTTSSRAPHRTSVPDQRAPHRPTHARPHFLVLILDGTSCVILQDSALHSCIPPLHQTRHGPHAANSTRRGAACCRVRPEPARRRTARAACLTYGAGPATAPRS